ncbi:MAG: hypothetical protein OQJ78_08070 [Ignavibacteriaceae bacterium]|nr:hypothetical protein [Ignavibacteriaceae bacterium]
MNISAQIFAEILTPSQMLDLEKRLRSIVTIGLEDFLLEYRTRKSITSKSSYLKRSINLTIKKLILKFGKEIPVTSISKDEARKFMDEFFAEELKNQIKVAMKYLNNK